MSDNFEPRGEFAPADSADVSTEAFVPNGFVKLGLAPELMRAIEDLGFTQPTAVQERTIPMALPSQDEAAGHIDLMVSSQTGSGKTAAFLLPVLHTLIAQRAAADAKPHPMRAKSR